MNIHREYFPLGAAEQELRDFRTGKILGPLTELAMSLQDEQQNIVQVTHRYDPMTTDRPHYPLRPEELTYATPLRDKKTGKIIQWVPWSEAESTEGEG